MQRNDTIAASFAYDDLREWLAEAERLGEVEVVKNASWQKDIGLAAELVNHSATAPCVLFDEVPGFPKGFRVLVNFFGGRRTCMTLGFPTHLSKSELSEAFLQTHLKNRSTVPAEMVETGPVFENVATGKDVNLARIPTPKWHEDDGGPYIGTGCMVIMKEIGRAHV